MIAASKAGHREPYGVLAVAGLFVALASCGGDGSSNAAPAAIVGPQLRIVTVSGAPLVADAGDALPLKVVQVAADGTMSDLPAGAVVAWTSPPVFTALAPGSQAPALLPPSASVPGTPPSATWIDDGGTRPDRSADLADVLFVVDPGTIQNVAVAVSATVSGAKPAGDVQAAVAVWPTPAGDAGRGKGLFGPGGANCGRCHGPSGHGSPETGPPYTIDGQPYGYPAPGLNAEPGHLASNSSWNPALLALAARADIDNHGVALRVPMPDWLTSPNPATGRPPSTQDFADIYAFLRTQTQ